VQRTVRGDVAVITEVSLADWLVATAGKSRRKISVQSKMGGTGFEPVTSTV
jgi:hypothetical protein